VTPALYLLDPDPAPGWAPFAGVRPLSELRVGAHLVRERWEAFLGTEVAEIFALPHLAGFAEAGSPPCRPATPLPDRRSLALPPLHLAGSRRRSPRRGGRSG